MHERLAELCQRESRKLAAAALEGSLAYAQPGLGRAQKKVRGAAGAGGTIGAAAGASCI